MAVKKEIKKCTRHSLVYALTHTGPLRIDAAPVAIILHAKIHEFISLFPFLSHQFSLWYFPTLYEMVKKERKFECSMIISKGVYEASRLQ